jgi:hypothetical protein
MRAMFYEAKLTVHLNSQAMFFWTKAKPTGSSAFPSQVFGRNLS